MFNLILEAVVFGIAGGLVSGALVYVLIDVAERVLRD